MPLEYELMRTARGIAHVRICDFRSLGCGLAYAYTQDSVCMFAASFYTDLKNENSDFFFKGYFDIIELKSG